MLRIQLTQGQVVIVDDVDYPLLADFRWCYRPERNGKQGYAVRHRKVNGIDRLRYLHRDLMNPGSDQEVIFLNHDRLDCRRENLRIVSKQEARQHHRVRRDSKSGAKGVRYHEESDRWSATIYRDGHCHHVGTFISEASAVKAYESALYRENRELHTAPDKIERPDTLHPVAEQQEGMVPLKIVVAI